mmetsp:Transcript_20188/g.29702  ORF Transcript_20188/g.29702 Transcript_20188/m.29702 type:complete len:421 (-) Transcript_20188:165-1427(-)|eukprot:CAMPEP_0194080446 /NCGR_PEP_ID=MMETSP0149-20130528/6469_1 /TAXON_ID=122233 /ORGANISM="Chaetoceros debilis, Strain MM31A-1" /LENGTH=420 /DNA_ID=CAMNT_0038762165 /DNA_START=143 /DNA_END=1405 /DNA_ORIENTATION=+
MRVPPEALLSIALFPSLKKSVVLTSKRSVHIHGRVSFRPAGRLSPSTHSAGERPVDPNTLSSSLPNSVSKLKQWFDGKQNILCLTGAGISTDSGIPDYRGHKGSYHKGHKPMIHDQFINSHAMRQRYWGRSMMGWKEFAQKLPNDGHYALAELERMGKIGVAYKDSEEYYKPGDEDAELKWAFTNGSESRTMSIITQNVDGLHRKGGSDSTHITELHGRNDRLVCMTCGSFQCRHQFHDQLDDLNSAWVDRVRVEQDLQTQMQASSTSSSEENLRPDGDAYVARDSFDEIDVPSCSSCNLGNGGSMHLGQPITERSKQLGNHSFLKPDVVFFGDSVPKYQVNRCYAAVNACDGLLCIGSSLAVHSAYRFVNHAAENGIPIAILNVGETRAEVNKLDVLKIESPAGPTLSALASLYASEEK